MTDSRLSTTGQGDCFSVALWLVKENPTWRLCHGTVVRDEDGLHHSHAWCEYDEVVNFPNFGPATFVVAVDKANGHDVSLPAPFYRKVGQAHDVTEYDAITACRLAVRHGHYGPWEGV